MKTRYGRRHDRLVPCRRVQIQRWVFRRSGLLAAQERAVSLSVPPEMLLWLILSHKLISTRELMAISSATLSFAAPAKWNCGHCQASVSEGHSRLSARLKEKYLPPLLFESVVVSVLFFFCGGLPGGMRALVGPVQT